MAVATSTALLAGAAASGGAAALDYKANKDAVKSMERQKADSQAFIDQQINRARGDIFKLYPAAQESRQQGLQAGLDLFRQSVPAQFNTFRQGNVGAQQQLIAGLPQMQNAILGMPVDYSQFQPTFVGGLSGLQMPQAPQPHDISQIGLG